MHKWTLCLCVLSSHKGLNRSAVTSHQHDRTSTSRTGPSSLVYFVALQAASPTSSCAAVIPTTTTRGHCVMKELLSQSTYVVVILLRKQRGRRGRSSRKRQVESLVFPQRKRTSVFGWFVGKSSLTKMCFS